jgi:hypothetical protein
MSRLCCDMPPTRHMHIGQETNRAGNGPTPQP